MSKVNMNEVLVDINGEPLIKDAADGSEEDLTVGMVFVNALLHPRNEDEHTTGEMKLARFNLAQTINGAKEPIEVADADRALLKKLVNKVYPALYVGQVYKILDREGQKGE